MDKEILTLIEKAKVEAVINKLFICTDNREWEKVRECFDFKVLFDMSSMSGLQPTVFEADQIVREWKEALGKLEAIHHQAGNYITNINGSEASVFCYGISFHYLPNPSGENTRTFVGPYNFRLFKIGEDWKINVFKYNSKFIEGNLRLGE